MAELVAAAIDRERHLVVQAGTGTGKTLAYLVPAIAAGKRVVVATATKALQDQLGTKDLPFLQGSMSTDFEFAVLKGRSNYVCLQRLRELLGEPVEPAGGSNGDGPGGTADDDGSTSGARSGTSAAQGEQGRLDLGEIDSLSAAVRADVRRIAAWVTTTATGDVTQLDFAVDEAALRAVTVGSEECPGRDRCPLGGPCFAERARDRAKAADVVVVNTHLYGLDIAAGGAVLPEHDVAIFDEAHVIEDVMSATVGVELAPGRFLAVAAAVRRFLDDPATVGALFDCRDLLQRALTDHVGQRLRLPYPSALQEALVDCRLRLEGAVTAIAKANPANEDAKQRRLRAQLMVGRTIEIIDAALQPAETAGRERLVDFVSGGPQFPRLELAPLDVGPTLADGVWSRRTAVLTSATIPTSIVSRLGLPTSKTDTADVGSPFDYESHGMLYCPVGLPDPRHGDFRARVHDELVELIAAAGGRTLALFTSYKAMDEAAAAVRERLDLPILTQRELPKQALLTRFAADEATSLFATSGFFQGVDVPGRTLIQVIIDRLPFPRPDDPLLSARRETLGPAAFMEIDVPRAATMLAQAAGRLIRTAQDRGVVAVLDRRLGTARYRWDIVKALPPMRRTRHRADVTAFLVDTVAAMTAS